MSVRLIFADWVSIFFQESATLLLDCIVLIVIVTDAMIMSASETRLTSIVSTAIQLQDRLIEYSVGYNYFQNIGIRRR